MVGVAQLVRVLDCGSRCRRFNSGHPPKRRSIFDLLFLCHILSNVFYNEIKLDLFFFLTIKLIVRIVFAVKNETPEILRLSLRIS